MLLRVVVLGDAVGGEHGVLEPAAASGLRGHAEGNLRFALLLEQFLHLCCGDLGQLHARSSHPGPPIIGEGSAKPACAERSRSRLQAVSFTLCGSAARRPVGERDWWNSM